jgi:glycosyltransferase involved in cell wall biosynthesis
MHVLVTTDTISGVWSYTRELVSGLVSRGLRVTLVSFGEVPLPEQASWMDSLHGLDYRPTGFRLEWMHEGEQDYAESAAYLTSIIEEIQPDVLHLNQFCYGDLPVDIPRVVVAHGDLITWWVAVHGREPKAARWLSRYRDVVGRGLSGSSMVVAPSAFMLDALRTSYAPAPREQVIYNGRNPIFFNPYVSKEDSVLSVGRLLDAGKQVHLLTQHEHPLSVCIVGSDNPVNAPRIPIRADVKVSTDQLCVSLKGPQTEAQLRNLYSRAAVYAATARYEPFGMEPLEAALSRCAIIANDIPSYREIWGDDAIYFRTNDATSLAHAIRELGEDREKCRAYGNRAYQRARDRYNHKRMIDEYLHLYRSLAAERWAAA